MKSRWNSGDDDGSIVFLTYFLMKRTFSWFTLVELVVVIAIIAILATIWFISYTSYMTGVRDTKRVSDLVIIHDWLQSAISKWSVSLPDSYLTINANGTLVWYQWYVWAWILSLIWLQSWWKDPKDDSYYTYYLFKDKKNFQLMAWLEDSPDKLKITWYNESIFPQAYAWTPDYINRYPKVYGKQLWVLTDWNHTPVQELLTGSLDIAMTANTYTAYLTDSTSITWSWNILVTTLPNMSCKRIRDIGIANGDGVYRIAPHWDGWYDVWCDMTTDWGGWTMATMLADSTTQNLFDTGNATKITDIKSNISTKWTLAYSWGIWLDALSRDIMIECFSEKRNLLTYSKPFIIYNFLQQDLPNLILQNKNNAVLSLNPLIVKYNGTTSTIYTHYGNDPTWSPQSMYFVDTSWKNYFWMKYWTWLQVSNNTSWVSTAWPLYNSGITVDEYAPLSSTTYCVSAVR